jgi:hypothetical protein
LLLAMENKVELAASKILDHESDSILQR